MNASKPRAKKNRYLPNALPAWSAACQFCPRSADNDRDVISQRRTSLSDSSRGTGDGALASRLGHFETSVIPNDRPRSSSFCSKSVRQVNRQPLSPPCSSSQRIADPRSLTPDRGPPGRPARPRPLARRPGRSAPRAPVRRRLGRHEAQDERGTIPAAVFDAVAVGSWLHRPRGAHSVLNPRGQALAGCSAAARASLSRWRSRLAAAQARSSGLSCASRRTSRSRA